MTSPDSGQTTGQTTGQPNPPGGIPYSGIWKMPDVIVRFRLPDEQTEFNAAMQGGAAKAAIWEVDQYCRTILKHGEPSEDERRHLERIRDILRERAGLLDD